MTSLAPSRSNTADQGLEHFFKQVGNHRILSAQEEAHLFERLEAGDAKAREEIIGCNQRFVIKIARQFRKKHVSLADLIQEGNVGLLQAVDRFDWHRRFRFSTYAAYYIRQEIQAALYRSGSMIRLPVRKARLMGRLDEATRTFEECEGREPQAEELAFMVGEDTEKVIEVLALRHNFTSLDRETMEDGPMLAEIIEDPTAVRPGERLNREQTAATMVQCLELLNPREQEVLNLRYGIGTGRALSLRGASKHVGLSQEGVRRVEMRALDKLRRPAIRCRLEGLLTA